MTTTSAPARGDGYVLGRNPQEYRRLRAQAAVWNRATARLLDEIGLDRGARCLDAGCGAGEAMRLMAERVGPEGHVLGVDVDVTLGTATRFALGEEGLDQCDVVAHDVTGDEPLPGAPFDLVYARLLLFHLPQRVAVLRRLWDAVAPGGHLLVQDYDLHGVRVLPPLASSDEVMRLLIAGMTAAGCDVSTGGHLPALFGQAGLGEPDGTDVAGLIQPVPVATAMLDATVRSVLPAALAAGVTTPADAEHALDDLARDVAARPEGSVILPLMVGAWKHKPAAGPA